MGSMKKIAVVGFGSTGQRHVRNLLTLGISDITVIRHRKHPVNASDLFRAVRVCDEMETCLKLKPDAAIIANPTSLHMSTVIMVAEQGCHLFIEKPVSHNV
jgi:predicted dehydrogenase